MDYETNLSTQQDPPQKKFRLQSPHENSGRKKSDQPQTQSGKKAPGRVNTFPKSLRLTSRFEFQRVASEKRRVVGKYLCLDWRPAKQTRLGISASSRYGNAPERNRFKRLVREAFRHSKHSLPKVEINVIPRQFAKEASFSNIFYELNRLL